MKEFRHEIPTRAFINGMIIDRANQTPAFRTCIRQTLSECCIPPPREYEFRNPAYVVGLLYCLIVVPKEIWGLHEDDVVYKNLEKDEIASLFTLHKKDERFDSNPTYYLIHRLRNAVAHANFSIDDSQDFLFWDKRSKTEDPNWEASISHNQLMEFLSKLGHSMDKVRTANTGARKRADGVGP